MVREIVGSASEWLGALKDFHRQCDDGSIVLYQLRAFLEHRDPFTTLPDIDWPLIYLKLGMEVEAEAVKGLVMPPQNPAIWWVPMVHGITSNRIVTGHRNFGVDYSLYNNDLDTAVPKHDRDPNRDGNYVVGFRRVIEADEENAERSANNLVKVNRKGNTLLERLLLGAGFHITTGQHLDIVNWTLCPGSRDRVGSVPDVDYNPDSRKVYVYCCSPDYSSGRLRSRSAQFPLPA